VLNPKCVQLGELYGQFNPATHEWEEGLVGDIMHQCVADVSQAKKWIIFDGPVDPLWIESI
jgi:dynein heavy chain